MSASITVMNRLFWPTRFGGLESVLWQLTNGFVDAGVRVSVLTESVNGSPDLEDARPRLSVSRFAPVQFGRLWRVGELVQVRWWMHAIQAAPKTDYLLANEPTAAAAAILLGRRRELIYRPVFCFAAMHHVSRTHPEMAVFARTRLSRRLDRFAYRRAGFVIDESRNLQRQQARWYGQRPNVQVIHNATTAVHELSDNSAALPPLPPREGEGDGPSHLTHLTSSTTPRLPRPLTPTLSRGEREQDSRARLGLAPHHFVIGFVGRPGDPCKDLPFLLRALTHRPLPDHVRLLIVGGGDGFDQAQAWVRAAGLDAHTRWTGNLADTAPAYRAMDTLVLPSRFETFGNVIIEAQAHGVPTIGRRFTDHPTAPIYTASEELIAHGQTGLTCHPHDPSDLATQLHRMIANPAQTKAMGREAARRRADRPWSAVIDQYLVALTIPSSDRQAADRAAA